VVFRIPRKELMPNPWRADRRVMKTVLHTGVLFLVLQLVVYGHL